MSGHEARINEALKALGEEYRLGMVALDEYRARRRLLLASWNERDSTTSPGSAMRATLAQPQRGPGAVVPPPGRTPKKRGAAGLVLGALALVAVAGAGYYLMRKSPPPADPAPARATAPLPASVVGIKKAADDFLARNSWEPEPIEAFLRQWRALTPSEQARAKQEPSLKTLLYQLDQNIQAEAQLAGADAPPEQRERLEMLRRFAGELGG